MNDKERKSARGLREQLLTLLNGWDPAGLLAAGAPRDEYVGVVDELLSLLSRDGSTEEVTAFLEHELPAHFGVPVAGSEQFAKKAVNWYRLASAEQ